MKHTREDLKIMQGWSLQRKIQVTQARILEWYEYYEGNVYVSFSGGKDSTVLLDLARRCYPDIEAVFCDTGLEYPETRDFAKSQKNITIIRPKLKFKQIVEQYGYPVISKTVAHTVYYARKKHEWALKAINGIGDNERQTKFRKRFIKYKFLTEAPFYISDYCCEFLKKNPLKHYQKEIGKKSIIATMASESQRREANWLKNGCNSFDIGSSQPMSFWTEQDVLQYLRYTEIPYASVYGKIISKSNQLSLFENDSEPLATTGCDRTGCMFCCFGIKNDPTPNRFQRMKITHPKLYDYCINGGEYNSEGMLNPDKNGLGIGKILDYIGIPY